MLWKGHGGLCNPQLKKKAKGYKEREARSSLSMIGQSLGRTPEQHGYLQLGKATMVYTKPQGRKKEKNEIHSF